jgi:Predicted transcriptional regulators
MDKFAARLKELRKRDGLTQSNMAEFLHVTERHYRLYEAGKVDPPTSKLIRLRNHFNVTADYLLGISDDATPPKHKLAED